MHTKGQMGIYIHWPFCLAKCPYCDFNSHVSQGIDQSLWLQSYLASLGYYAELTPQREVVSIFFGGGTPSLMPPETVAAIIDTIQKKWRISNNIEITLEANPTSVEAGKFVAFRQAGINRVSLGVQAMNDNDLKFLGRQHSAAEAIKAVAIARDNFERYNFDLIYARPQQTLKDWEAELKGALKYTNGHLSLYQLTIERGTPFFLEYNKGAFTIPDEDMAADFYNLTQDILESENLPAYEVSNHAHAGQESRHNMLYWRYQDYIGIGPGAHGRITLKGGKMATREHRAPDIWLERVASNGNGAHPFELVPPKDRFMEGLMMGLRLREGLDMVALETQTGLAHHDMIDENHKQHLMTEGYLAQDENIWRLNREGLLRLNAVLPYLLKAA